ncbi:WecB/TagA/CpsF family glycosyltransferase [Aporhodopirellula aestuarii]|uniref:WecB/TagA/CpsF family glycosyltransferase n=1 Tax=Aporhodopirellula aestuarii TaxID=2950107 RepID=A0ABT0U464_9BACT|nr:WecB/TagA/CpsF family glycosyltransferase [Aporhodopirellula aestuarii]MCM2371228.1 WecB/TagA/CpsF family glycosyltransferase [Aporhodopirellula aestuarii]
MLDYGKHSVLGIGVDAIDYDSAVEKIIDGAKAKRAMTVTALAVHGVMTGVLDREYQYRLNQFDLVCPDGQPVRWALNSLHAKRFAGGKLSDRVYGPELTLRLCEAAAKQDVTVFLFGATEEMLSRFATKLGERFEGLQIVGQRASAFRQITSQERDDLAAEIIASGAQMCFVGLGCPRQEIFAYEMRERLPMPLIAVGAAFAFHAGVLKQAPPWMQRSGLEWLFRLTREPGRLWRRYLYLNPTYVTLLALQKIGLYRKSTDGGKPPQDELLFG